MKRLSAMVLALCLVICAGVSAHALGQTVTEPGNPVGVPVYLTCDPALFRASIPTSLAVHVDGDGAVTCPTNLAVCNLGAAPVKVSGISITPEKSWEIKSWDHDMKKEPAGTGMAALRIGDSVTDENGILAPGASSFPAIMAGERLEISMDAHIPVQTGEKDGTKIMSIIFVLEWV